MLPADEIVVELTQLVWSTMLLLDAATGGGSAEETSITAAVDIRGAWEGTVAMSFPSGLPGPGTLSCPRLAKSGAGDGGSGRTRWFARDGQSFSVAVEVRGGGSQS